MRTTGISQQRNIAASPHVHRVFFTMAFSAVSVGQWTSMLPDYLRARLSAGLVFSLLEAETEIDGYSDGGVRPVSRLFRDICGSFPLPGGGWSCSTTGKMQRSIVAVLGSQFADMLICFIVAGRLTISGHVFKTPDLQHRPCAFLSVLAMCTRSRCTKRRLTKVGIWCCRRDK